MPGRIRTIKPEWLDDEKLLSCSSDARVLSVALILLADDYGNGRCYVPTIASRVFPAPEDSRESLASPSVLFREAFDQLAVSGYARRYSVNGQMYFSIRNWSKHQRVDHPSKPLVPSPPDDLWESEPELFAKPSRESSESLAPDLDQYHDHDLELLRDKKSSRSLTTKSAVKPKSKKQAITNDTDIVSSHAVVMEAYSVAFEKARGVKPVIGPREGKSVKSLLKSFDNNAAKACECINNAFSDNWWKNKATIVSIASEPSKFLGKSTQPPVNRGTSRGGLPPQPLNTNNPIIPNRVEITEEDIANARDS